MRPYCQDKVTAEVTRCVSDHRRYHGRPFILSTAKGREIRTHVCYLKKKVFSAELNRVKPCQVRQPKERFWSYRFKIEGGASFDEESYIRLVQPLRREKNLQGENQLEAQFVLFVKPPGGRS